MAGVHGADYVSPISNVKARDSWLWPPWGECRQGHSEPRAQTKQAGTATQGTNGNVKDKGGRCDTNGQHG